MNKLQKIATLHKLAALRKVAVITVLTKQAQKDVAKQAILQRYIQKHAELTPEQIRKLKRIAGGKSRGWLKSMLTGGIIGGGLGAGIGGYVGDQYAADKWDRTTRLDPKYRFYTDMAGSACELGSILGKGDAVGDPTAKPGSVEYDPGRSDLAIWSDKGKEVIDLVKRKIDTTQKYIRDIAPSRNHARLAGTGAGALIGALPGIGLGVGVGAIANALNASSERARAQEILDAEGINYDLG